MTSVVIEDSIDWIGYITMPKVKCNVLPAKYDEKPFQSYYFLHNIWAKFIDP